MTWTALPETGYKCQACDTTIRGTKKGQTYIVVNANTDEEAYADATGKGAIYR